MEPIWRDLPPGEYAHIVDGLSPEQFEFTLKGTHTDNFMGIPATGKPVSVAGVAILQVADGQVKELRAQFDQVGLMQQLGVMG